MRIPSFSKFPWKEVMFGEGILNIAIGVSVMIAVKTFAEPTFNLLQGLSLEQLSSFLQLVAKGIIAFGFLNLAFPLLFVSVSKLLQPGQSQTVSQNINQE